ncbi:protein kinase [Nonomuraea sp. SMC257]|uniref:non-specific serine/threonine protein kinase n=1 Tax=Nonomuraea montanisoli TaxID=2741721 RepID=A0A7Y6M4Z3_9ACTN|nr:serine/threonine-protein kinase [Nonomuraea montanisoli]NUW33995.1 protein kinase [Nonomuraea montanisoli]
MPHVEPLREGDPAAVGPYRLAGRLGAGSQGVVYLAKAPNGAPVAVKVLHEGLAGDDRLVREMTAARQVEPVNVAQVLDASVSGRPYLVSEYVDGPSLQQAGRRTGAELQRLAVATATALAAIHRAGLAHRDFKPACVLLGSGGPRVIGFGVTGALDSKLSATSNIVGTPAYMAPEQLAGQAVGPAADVFAWGSVIVFAATGTPPFGDDSLPAVINRILRAEPRLGELPQALRAAVTRCLAKDPAARPAMHEVLLHLLGSPASPAASNTPSSNTPSLNATSSNAPSSTPPHGSPAAPHPSSTPPHGSPAAPHPSAAGPHVPSAGPFSSPAAPQAAPVFQDRSSTPSRSEGPAEQWHTAPQAAAWQEPVSQSTDPVRPVTGPRGATWPPAAGAWEDSHDHDIPQPTAAPPGSSHPGSPGAQPSGPGAFGTGGAGAFGAGGAFGTGASGAGVFGTGASGAGVFGTGAGGAGAGGAGGHEADDEWAFEDGPVGQGTTGPGTSGGHGAAAGGPGAPGGPGLAAGQTFDSGVFPPGAGTREAYDERAFSPGMGGREAYEERAFAPGAGGRETYEERAFAPGAGGREAYEEHVFSPGAGGREAYEEHVFSPGAGGREAYEERAFASGAGGSAYGEQVWPPVERPDGVRRQEGAPPEQWAHDDTRPAPGAPWPGGEARPASGEPEQWDEEPTGEPAPAKPRGRRGKKVVIAVASGLTAVALGGAIVWLTPSSPQPRSQSLVSASSGASPSASPTPSRKRPTKTRTPAPADHGSASPDATRSAEPDGTGSPTAGTVTGRLRLSYVRALGTRNGTCWAGDQVTLTALVERGGERLPFGYVWMVDGRVTGRASTVVEEDGRLVVNAPRALTADGGTHLVTFRITTPVTRQRSLSLTFCQP